MVWTRALARRLVAVAIAVVLAGCGGGGDEPRAFNATDVMFLQMMIPHSDQGTKMAELAKTRAGRAEVRDLAAAVETTQRDEVETMTAWLREWQQPTTVDNNPQVHAGHGGMQVTSDEVVANLAKASGTDFERLFLNTLTGHQHGAVELARMETDGGSNPEVKDFAERIIKSRTAQIQQMLAMIQQPAN